MFVRGCLTEDLGFLSIRPAVGTPPLQGALGRCHLTFVYDLSSYWLCLVTPYPENARRQGLHAGP
jgi:hypothetical protein